MTRLRQVSLLALPLVTAAALAVAPPARPDLAQAANTWVKRSPLRGGPPSPGMGYEASLVYDPVARRVVRWGGHNQGGGGEQNAELWLYDPRGARWELREPDTSPPGVCCAQQNVFDADQGRFLRFAAFSGNHGWQWFREIYLGNSSVWAYDLATNSWRDRRPLPAPVTGPLRCASWDSHHGVAVVFGGEGAADGTLVYDPHTNTWARRRPRPEPAGRSGGNLAYDAARRLHVLFGSQFGDDGHTWAYDLRQNAWLDRRPARQPPTNLNDAVLAYDPANKVIVAVVRVADRFAKNEVTQGHLETWAYDAGANTWAPLKPPREPDGWRNRRRLLVAVPDQNVLVLENYVTSGDRIPGLGREQQVWTYRYAEPRPDPTPRPAAQVRVRTTPSGAVLRWRPSPSAGVAAHAVYRGEGAQPWQAEFRPVARVKEGDTFHDTGLKTGVTYYYLVRALDRAGRESEASGLARTQPRVVEEASVSVLGPREVRLAWAAPAGDDLAGYHVERAAVEVSSDDEIKRLKTDTPPLPSPSVGAVRAVGPFTRLTRTPVKGTTFRDTGLDLTRPAGLKAGAAVVRRFRADQLDAAGKPYRFAVYAYRVRAVNALGVEGGPSPYWLTIPSAPRWLFAREDGGRCHLRWAANPEQGLKGYRVYRMESPRRNGPGQPVARLTADPLAAPRFVDPKAGKVTRRYWVVAVDALGQEGQPSAPAWHEREYRRFYAPFVGPWHQ
jgi:hypothetical protein